MEKIILDVTEGVYATAKEARSANRIPMAYYGKGVENHGFSVDYQDFRRAYEQGGRSTIMYFKNEKEEEFPVLVQDIQYEPVSDQIIHVDVMAVQMGKAITTQVPLVLVGVAPAVKDLAGVMIQSKETIEVECLPKDLIHEIEVDISPLVDFHTSLTIGDIKVPDTIKILDAEDINILTVSAPRAAVEEETTTTEEGAEGEAPAEGAEGEAP
ncbi:50S ribosomal protein L25, partial [Candidatus Pacearchaeota archaeon]|nr:50S ribosomal protein L25 [Candidatus Pacearchaeota archaeon]